MFICVPQDNAYMYDVVIGRSEEEKQKYGSKGAILLGKHYVKMGQTTSLSNNIYLDVTKSHIVFVVGKRGSGKSYSMGVIAEGMADLPKEINQNLAVVMLDTMGIYWTMKYPNKKEEHLLKEWGLEGKGLDIQIYTPKGYYTKYKEAGIPTDHPFSIKPSELDAADWCTTFGIKLNEPQGVLIERLLESMEGKEYSIHEVISELQKDLKADPFVKDAVENRFLAAEGWGIFDKEGTPFHKLVSGGQVTVLDVSCYTTIPGAVGIRALVIGLVAEKLFIERMIARKKEEYASIHASTHFLGDKESDDTKEEPLVWLIIDEAHEFLPNDSITVATTPLVTILREGRQPGISLILASQQPGKIHTDVMTQSDVVLAHRITANVDVQALGMLMQSYMREGLDKQLNVLPRVKGAAIIFDDMNERLYSMRVRPRYTWHGGEAPSALVDKKNIFDF